MANHNIQQIKRAAAVIAGTVERATTAIEAGEARLQMRKVG
jgi:hypothetical protein